MKNWFLKRVLFLAFFLGAMAYVEGVSYRFQEYAIDLPKNWVHLSDAHLAAYLGYKMQGAKAPWNDPAFVRGWSEEDAKGARQTLCTLYRMRAKPGIPYTTYARAIVEQYALKVGGVHSPTVTAVGQEIISGVPTRWFDVEMISQEKKITVRHFVLVHGEYVYYIYFTAAPKYFKKHEQTYSQIAKSLEIFSLPQMPLRS